jgi:phosphatidylglycerol:prolipoprotein diacylglycerol transferase
MHPILFKIPLHGISLPYVWLPLIVAAIAALVAVAKMLGKEKDRQGAALAGAVAVLGVLARFTVLKGNEGVFNPDTIPIYSYGVMLGLSLVVGWYLTLGLAERDGLPKETMANNYVVTAIAAVAGARILYILTNLSEFTQDPRTHDALPFLDVIASFFAMRRGGLVAYGGFLGGLAGSYFFLRRHKLPLLPWADVAVPSLASGLMITRIGCYMFGCDFGQPLKDGAPDWLKSLGTFKHWPAGTLDQGEGAPAWAQHVKEKLIQPSAEASLPVHPTQLYESLVGACLLGLLLWYRRKQKFRGEIFFLFAFAYGACRFLLEVLRDDAERGAINPPIPQHILIPLAFAVLSVGWVIGFSQRIENKGVRLASQIASFLPLLPLYLAYKPETFAATTAGDLSTSQLIGVLSGIAASMAFAVFYKAALAHPKQAMDLRLPPAFQPAMAGGEPAPAVSEDDDEEEVRVRPKKVKGKGRKGRVGAKKPRPAPKEAEAEGDAAPPQAEAEVPAKEEAASSDEEGPRGPSDEPLKAS